MFSKIANAWFWWCRNSDDHIRITIIFRCGYLFINERLYKNVDKSPSRANKILRHLARAVFYMDLSPYYHRFNFGKDIANFVRFFIMCWFEFTTIKAHYSMLRLFSRSWFNVCSGRYIMLLKCERHFFLLLRENALNYEPEKYS